MSDITQVQAKGSLPIQLDVVTDFVPYPFLYKARTKQNFTVRQTGTGWELTVGCPDTVNGCVSTIFLRTNADVEECEDGLRILTNAGRTEIFLSCGAAARCGDAAASRERTAAAWRTLWEKSGKASFPDGRIQQTYVRSLAPTAWERSPYRSSSWRGIPLYFTEGSPSDT